MYFNSLTLQFETIKSLIINRQPASIESNFDSITDRLNVWVVVKYQL